MVTICGNASVFKTNFQADLENYTPSLENMRKIVALLYHDPKWQTPENIQERYEASVIPGAWEALSAARLRSPAHQARSCGNSKKLSRSVPLLIMSCGMIRSMRKTGTWVQKIVRFQDYRFENSSHEPQIEETEESTGSD
jgi:hypothetical protein